MKIELEEAEATTLNYLVAIEMDNCFHTKTSDNCLHCEMLDALNDKLLAVVEASKNGGGK